jgi:hypothetical protein
VIRQTANAMLASAERVQKIEARAQAVAERAVKELQNAQARIEALEARLSAAEAREKGSALRAEEAENWLRRIHDAITQELPVSLGLLDNVSGRASG